MIFKQFVDYVRNNPEGYWFKRKPYGWGWVPVTWQGWLVVGIGIAMFVVGIYVSEIDDAPGAAVIGFLCMTGLIFFFGYRKGEKPRWQWGLPEERL